MTSLKGSAIFLNVITSPSFKSFSLKKRLLTLEGYASHRTYKKSFKD